MMYNRDLSFQNLDSIDSLDTYAVMSMCGIDVFLAKSLRPEQRRC